jgi:acyl carrier protein
MPDRARVSALLRKVLEVDPGAPLSRASVERWDSLKHIEVIFALEDEFEVTIPEDRFESLDSLDAICGYLDGEA